MKKILLFVFLSLLSNSLFGNPVAPPQALISEFMFTSNNKWEMEISFTGLTDIYLHGQFDSICIATTAGMARIRLDFVRDSTSLLVITLDSLLNPLSINRSGDSIKLYSYGSIYLSPLVDIISFGSYPSAMFDSIPAGYSISRFGTSLFALDKNPTFGAANDSTVLVGHWKDLSTILMGRS